MMSEPGSSSVSADDSVVLASFDGYRSAEHLVASLGRGFRRKARKRGAIVVVVRGNPDGSLKVTDSRVLEAGDLTAVLMRISLSVGRRVPGAVLNVQGGKDRRARR
jgi:hypothetical protein